MTTKQQTIDQMLENLGDIPDLLDGIDKDVAASNTHRYHSAGTQKNQDRAFRLYKEFCIISKLFNVPKEEVEALSEEELHTVMFLHDEDKLIEQLRKSV